MLKNSNFKFETLLILAYQAISEELALLQNDSQTVNEDIIQLNNMENRSISYLLLPEPRRGGNQPKSNLKTNSYVFVEFGLKIFMMAIRNRSIKPEEIDHIQMLDPYLVLLSGCMKSDNVKVR